MNQKVDLSYYSSFNIMSYFTYSDLITEDVFKRISVFKRN